MARGDTQTYVLEALVRAGHQVEAEAAFPWLTGRGPIEPVTSRIPDDVVNRLLALHRDLGGIRQKLEVKASRPLPVDFHLAGKVLVELDESQHFSSAREQTLDYYNDLSHGLDVPRYRELCVRYRDDADRYRRTKTAADFLSPEAGRPKEPSSMR